MIRSRHVVPNFLKACPSLQVGWEDRIRHKDVHGDAPTDLEYVARHLIECSKRGDDSEFPAAFAFLERCFVEGDEKVVHECVFFLYPIWLHLKDRPSEAEAFEKSWLGPYSQAAWGSCPTIHRTIREGLAPFLDHVQRTSAERKARAESREKGSG